MRDQLRAASALTKLAFRAAPLHMSIAASLFLVRGVGSAADAWWLARLVDAVVRGDRHAAVVAAVGMAITSAVTYTAGFVNLDLRFRIEESTGHLIDRELIATMTAVPTLDLHERPEHLDKIEILRVQKGAVSQSVSAILEFISVFGSAGAALGLLATISPLLLLIPVGGVFALWASAGAQSADQRLADELAEPRRRAAHLFRIGTDAGAAKELRTFGIAPEIVRRHDDLFANVVQRYERVGLRWGVLTGAGWAVFGIVQVLAVAFVAWRAVGGGASVGDVVLVITLSHQVDAIVQQGTGMTQWLFGSLKAAGRYVAVLDAALALTEHAEPWEPAPVPDALQKGIELDDVSFSYADSDRPVLTGVDLTIPAGAIVAIVGENGAGKSTLVKLLGRYYTPTGGVLRVDGVDLARMDPAAWRARLSGAFQDHARFELVAQEVVGVGDLDRLDDEAGVLDALERAGGGDLPARLTTGMSTPLGKSFDEGIEPSGGQWQQLALGRALLRDRPLLLLLDEPTSALDPDAEHALFEGYAGAARAAAKETGAITLLVSHRFSTVRMADLIVVLADGTVTECGTHDELLRAGGTYAELFTIQARAYR